MACLLSELCEKEVVNMKDGAILGRIGDLQLNPAEAVILSMVIPGRPKLWGLLGREEDFVIPWDKIEVIGCDAILVCIEPEYSRKKKKGLFDFFKK